MAQSSQDVDWAAPEYFPTAHREQVEAPSGLLEYVPAGQLGQEESPGAGADLPSGQAGHRVVRTSSRLALPASQLRQSDSTLLPVVVE